MKPERESRGSLWGKTETGHQFLQWGGQLNLSALCFACTKDLRRVAAEMPPRTAEDRLLKRLPSARQTRKEKDAI